MLRDVVDRVWRDVRYDMAFSGFGSRETIERVRLLGAILYPLGDSTLARSA